MNKTKTLKFEHELAGLIRKGSKTSTWRIYDDKDLSVDDEVEAVDKVDPKNPSSWVTFGYLKIDQVVEKRLGEINEIDMSGHERFKSQGDMINTYREYYGPEVGYETPVKIVQFTFMPQRPKDDGRVVSSTTSLHAAKLYADGGSRGNPGPSASGFVIMTTDGDVVEKKGIYLGITTNNQAEYRALKYGLEEAHNMGVRDIDVYMDSLLVINQLKGIFKVKNRDLWPIHDAIVQLAKNFEHISFNHVPRILNKLADREVNRSLDAAASQQDGRKRVS